MANHLLPTTTDTYANVLTYLHARIDEASKWYNSSLSYTNPPNGTVRWNSTSKTWETNTGTAGTPVWSALSTSYSININGSVGATTPASGAFTTLTSSSAANLGAGSQVNSVDIVTTTGSQTLTNKTLTTPVISSISNGGTVTIPTGTRTLVATDTTDTLSNKTLTAPKFADLGFIADPSGAELVIFDQTATAVNEITIANAATAGAPKISATGTDANISLELYAKGTGTVRVGSDTIATLTASQTLTNKTLTTPVISSISNGGTVTIPTGTRTLVATDTTDTLSNKTLTAPKFADLGFIADANGNELLIFDSAASAVNEITITNAATTGSPSLNATGGDANINLDLIAKGTGNVRVGTDTVSTLTATQTLTNKTLTLPKINDTSSNNTYTFAVSELAADRTITLPLLTGNDVFVFEAFSQALSNKTLTAPKIVSGGYIADANGNEQIIFTTTASAVNELTIANAATAGTPTISASGGDANVSINLVPKGTGTVQVGGIQVVTTSATQTLSAKTLTLPKINDTSSNNTYTFAVSELTADRTVTLPLLAGNDTFVFEAHSQTLTNKTLSTGSTWSGNTLGISVGGTGTSTAPTQWGAIYAASATSYASTAAGTAGQFLTANTSAAPTWQSFDLSLHAPDSSYKKIVRVATTADLGASTFAGNVLTGFDDTLSLSVTTTLSTTATVASTAGIKVGAVISGNANIPAATTVTSITNATTFVMSAAATIAGTATTTFTQTIAALAIDGITLSVNDRVLVKDQSTLGNITATDNAKYNGIYYVSATGSTTVPWSLTRAVDADASTDLDGAVINVSVGTVNSGRTFKTTYPGTATLNTTPIYWNRVMDLSASALSPTPTTAVGFDVNTDTKTINFVTGNVTDLVATSFAVPTIQAVAASTYTRASTVYIAGAPVASTNATITTPYALYIAGGNSYTAGNLTVGGTSTWTGAVTASSTINSLTFAASSISSAAATALSVLTGTTGALTLDSGTTGAVNLGTNANAKTITIGNSTGATGVNINTGTGGIYNISTTALTNSIANNLRINHQTSGTPAAGIGVGIQFEQLTAAANTEIGMRLKALTTDVTATSEDFDFVVDLMAAGATAAEKFRVTSTGNIVLNNTSTIVPGSAFSYTLPTVTVASTLLASTGATAAAGLFNTSTTTPTSTTRLNYEGYLYPTYINLVGSADIATAASHYFVETSSDGFVRPKTLANTQAEIVTTSTVAAAGALAMGTAAKTAAYTVVLADRGDVLLCTNTWTLTLTAATTLGNGFSFGVVNAGTGTITIDPNASETIDGVTTKALTAGQSCILVTDGTSWRTVGLSGDGAVAGGVLYENGHTISSSYTLSTGKSAHMVGPLTVASGQTLTIPTGEALIVFGNQPTNNDTDVLIKGAQTFVGQKTFETMPTVAVPTSMVRVNTANGYGSTATKIRRFTNITTNQGVDITYSDSATNGASFTINTNGVYAISYNDQFTTQGVIGISSSSTELTTNIHLINMQDRLAIADSAGANYIALVSATVYLAAGSIIRPHTSGLAVGTASYAQFAITRVA